MAGKDKQKRAASYEYSQPPTEKTKRNKYKGVRMRSWGAWVSEIRAPNQKTKIWLGSHSTPEAAARSYDAALVCLKGSSATLNFPCSNYYVPDSVPSPRSIQKIAAAAANSSPSQAIHGHVSGGNASSSMSEYPYDPSMVESESCYDFDDMTQNHMYQYEYDENMYDYSLQSADDYYEDGDIQLWNFNQ